MEKIKHFFLHKLWDFSLKEKGFWSRCGWKMLRVAALSFKGFYQNNCTLRASSLTFYTLLSVVPVFALAFAVAQGFGFQSYLRDLLLEKFSENREFLLDLFNFSDRLLEQTKGGVIAGAGAIVLFWSATSLLASMESAFNQIWKAARLRSWRRILTDYFALILIAPFLLLLSSSLSLYVSGQLKDVVREFIQESALRQVSLYLIGWIPYALFWMLYAFLYFLLPNVRVRFTAALGGGIVAGILSLAVQAGYIFSQASVTHYSAIYGSFAALPLFMIWVQINWFILLFGVEISHAIQIQERTEYAFVSEAMSERRKLVVKLWVASISVKRMLEGKPVSPEWLLEEHRIPYRIAANTLSQLQKEGMLAELKEQKMYLPMRDATSLRVNDIIGRTQRQDDEEISFPEPAELQHIQEIIESFDDLINQSEKNLYLKDL